LTVKDLTANTKILQTHLDYLLLFTFREQLVLIRNPIVPPLTSLESCKERTMAGAQISVSCAGPFLSRFPRKYRNSCTDQHPSNTAGENIIEALRPGWSHENNPCLSHRLAHVYGKTYDLIPSNMRGMVRYELSLQDTAELTLWQESIFEEVLPRVVILDGYPPQRTWTTPGRS
jgi:hypothetical protein